MGVEGLIHTSQIGYSSSQNPQSAVKPGDRVLLKVLDVNPERKRVALSMRQVPLERQISWAMENVETSGTSPVQAAAAEEPPTMGNVTPEENHAETNELPSTHTLVSDENQPAGDEPSDSQSPQDSDTQ